MNTQGVEPGSGATGPSEDGDGVDQGGDEGFAPATGSPALRSHRRGMLAGLGAVGLLLAVLLLLGSGGSKPRLAAQGRLGHSPVTIPVRTKASVATTTTTATHLTVPTAPAGQGFVANASAKASSGSVPASPQTTSPTRTPTSTTALSTTTTSAPVAAPPPTAVTTTTTGPPSTTTTTSCILVVLCG